MFSRLDCGTALVQFSGIASVSKFLGHISKCSGDRIIQTLLTDTSSQLKLGHCILMLS